MEMTLRQILLNSRCFEKGDTLIVGFSGGADSLCLLDGLTLIAKEKNLRIIACHVHHSIRGNEADADGDACRQLAARLKAEFVLRKVDAPAYARENKLSLEEAARILRYRELEKLAEEIENNPGVPASMFSDETGGTYRVCLQQTDASLKCDAMKTDCAAFEQEKTSVFDQQRGSEKTKHFHAEPSGAGIAEAGNGDVRIAVAHTKSDLAETVLMRILRGTGPDGLAAIPSVGMVPGGEHQLVRPILAMTKEDTRLYCEERGFLPRMDSTNEDPSYVRNRIRKELMPALIKDYNPEIEIALGRLSSLAAIDRDFFETITSQLLEELTVETGTAPANDKTICPEKSEKTKAIEKSSEDSATVPENKMLVLRRKDLMELHPALGTRVIAQGLKTIGMEKDLSQVTLWAAWEMLQRGRGTGEAELSGGYRFKLDHEKAILYRKDTSDR